MLLITSRGTIFSLDKRDIVKIERYFYKEDLRVTFIQKEQVRCGNRSWVEDKKDVIDILVENTSVLEMEGIKVPLMI